MEMNAAVSVVPSNPFHGNFVGNFNSNRKTADIVDAALFSK